MTSIHYFDPIRNWRRIEPHLAAAEPVLVCDFNKYTWGRCRRKFEAGIVPREFESWLPRGYAVGMS